jgi:hypothetical protein
VMVEPMHVLEARGCLAVFHHHCRSVLNHHNEVVVLLDNLGVVLAISKGRCHDFQ